MSGAKLVFVVSSVLIVVTCAWALTRSPPRVVRTTVTERAELAFTVADASACQSDEVLPAHVSAIRLGLDATFGARLRVKVYSGSRLVTQGRRAADWTGGTVTVPVEPLDREASPVKLCFDVSPNSEAIRIIGFNTPPQEAAISSKGEKLSGRIGVEYLAAGNGSWGSRALSVARSLGIGRALEGTWVALLIVTIMAVATALALRLAWREFP